MVTISSTLQKVARIILAAGVKPQLLPAFFNALKDFLANEPLENFTHIKVKPIEHIKEHLDIQHLQDTTPLEMNAQAEKNLKERLSRVDPSLAAAVDTAKHVEGFY